MNIDFARRQMVEQQIRTWEVSDPRVLDVLEDLPREEFVPPGYEGLAFAETAIPLPHGQSMLTPMVEGRILQTLRIAATDDVLEIGTGSGFLTACMARLSSAVVSVDIFPDLVQSADSRLKNLGVHNATLLPMDATQKLPAERFDAVAVGGSMPLFDDRLLELLKPGGRLFVIVGTGPVMDARRVEVSDVGATTVSSLFETRVPALLNAPVPRGFAF